MDPDLFQGVAVVLAVMIPLLGVSIGGLLLLSRSNLGQALAKRIAGEHDSPMLREQVRTFQEDLADLRTQLQEMHERLDFTERLLARPEEARDAATRQSPGPVKPIS
jgi:hypothetical protein